MAVIIFSGRNYTKIEVLLSNEMKEGKRLSWFYEREHCASFIYNIHYHALEKANSALTPVIISPLAECLLPLGK